MFGKILCPVDFSPPSHAAVAVAARIAAADRSELVLAHAFHFPSVAAGAEGPLPGTTIQLAMDDEKSALTAVAEHASKLGARVTTRFLDGVPWQHMVDLAGNEGFDLIVVGTHGRTGLKRLLIGSVAEKIVRHAPTSVLVVRGNPDGPLFDHVLCPIDFSEGSSLVVERAGELANPSGAGLMLLHAIELPLAASGDPLLKDPIMFLDHRMQIELDRYRDEVVARHKLPVTAEVLTGTPVELMLAKVEEDRTFDLVVVGTHGRTGLKRVLLGSVAEKMVRHAPCSVLVVRGRD
ncbi:MAG: universal stress protein [Deltaproteobacteria bacterium]|nr:universal stress protein [Deltaproteobacteria bacterium]